MISRNRGLGRDDFSNPFLLQRPRRLVLRPKRRPFGIHADSRLPISLISRAIDSFHLDEKIACLKIQKNVRTRGDKERFAVEGKLIMTDAGTVIGRPKLDERVFPLDVT